MQHQPVEIAGQYEIAAAAENEARRLAQFGCGKLFRVADGGVEGGPTRQGEGVARREFDAVLQDHSNGASQYSASLIDMPLRFAQSSS